ncbi:RNA polymerase sigma factor (sigma-70 family) [Fontibacillus phaseoli]|uniref:RNA polymerase sigma factor (Sigma-70 family) n=1 Tax=Fontibacillus phaseoli TaxID=1416533 RepID=A0A369B8Z6_9BACL|nr:sigma-70 family RNA polymerase sigma factor [Fontibacillus phaseoli]RCX17016.1 RNA polymerase sigma factor (sigma-70 family) [Fontibacillus phaseoli]
MSHSRKSENHPSDQELVAQARCGHQDAFNKLMERHRRQALNWARKIADDPHLAEDIVQEGLISAFSYLGSLEQIEKFIPWFRRIITNQALMQVRRGGPYAKERPFSSYVSRSGDYEGENFQQIEFILGTLAKNTAKELQQNGDPAREILRLDTYDMLQEMLQGLGTKEREVFEAHFFKHYSPQEIAAIYSTSSSNIYTILSRTRKKISQARYESNLQNYLQSRHTSPSSRTRNQLQERGIYIGEIWDTYALSVQHALQYTNFNHYSMSEIMGLTGQAFRLQVHRDRVDLAGVTAFHWRNVFGKGLLNLGFAGRSIGDGSRIPQSHELLVEAFSFIHQMIDHGQPVIVWGVQLPFFAVIHGYDDEQRLFRITGLFEQTHLGYEELGREWSADLFALSLGTPIALNPQDALRGALGMVLTHAEGQERTPHADYVQGLAAYDSWISALSSGQVDPLSHAYTVWCTANARSFAVQFLELVANRPEVYGLLICRLAGEAADYYGKATDALRQMCKLFPFPGGGNPGEPEVKEIGLQLLEKAKVDEVQGLQILEALFLLLCESETL